MTKILLRSAAAMLCCLALDAVHARTVSGQASAPSDRDAAADAAVAIVPDPAADTPEDGTPGSVKLPPLPTVPAAAWVRRVDTPVPLVARSAVVGGRAAPVDLPIVAPSPLPLPAVDAAPAGAATRPSEVRQTPARRASVAAVAPTVARPGPVQAYTVHRDGRSWLVRRRGGRASVRAALDFGSMRLAPALADAARAGLVTLWVDAHPVGSRLVVTAVAGSVPDQARPAARWAR